MLELLAYGESVGHPKIHYDKFTDPVAGLSRDYHRRTVEEKSAMLADNLACLVDVLRQAGFSEDERQLVVTRYAEWLLSFQGTWSVVSEQPRSDKLTYAEVRPALARFISNALLSMVK